MADMPQPEAGLSKSEVEEIVKAAVAAIPQPDPGLTSAEAEQIARGVVASIPPKSAPADYTRYFVMGGPLSQLQGGRRCMPHPQTYRDGATLSRLKCTQ